MLRKLVVAGLLSGLAGAWAQTVRFRTTLGDIEVDLLPADAPATVQNFLNYVRRGAYTNTVIHRSVPGFVWQGGGFTYRDGGFVNIPSDPSVRNEFKISNRRGTIAMAKLGNDPNSATNQWFFNLSDDNARNLDNQNGGFTVFGRVANQAGLTVMDAIARVPVPNPGPLPSPYDQMPLIDYTGGTVQEKNLVIVSSISVLDPPSKPAISQNGVITVANFGGFRSAAPGSFIEIYGGDLAGRESRAWEARDFTNNNAPTSLDGVTVTIGGHLAYVNFISSNQVNVQVPTTAPTSGEAPVVVTHRGISSDPVMLPMKRLAPGLLAPPSFKLDDRQYIAALRADGTLVGNGRIEGVPNAPAVAGETLVFYGTGFGPVNPSAIAIAGTIVRVATTLQNPIEIRFGDRAAGVSYAGLAPQQVGLYQFNVTVPAGLPAGDVPLNITLNGEPIEQKLFIPVGGGN